MASGEEEDGSTKSPPASLAAFLAAGNACPHEVSLFALCEKTLPLATSIQITEFETEVRCVMARILVRQVRSGRPEPLRAAIDHLKRALQFYTLEDHPSAWVIAQMTLAIAWRNLTDGAIARNIDRAIVHYQRAVTRTLAFTVRVKLVRIYAVWEFYHKDGRCFLSKAIEVDERFQGQGIWSGLLDAVMLHHKGKIRLSGKYTQAGAALIRKYAVGWLPLPLDNWIRRRRHDRRQ